MHFDAQSIKFVCHKQKKPDWSKSKPGDAKVKEEAEGAETAA